MFVKLARHSINIKKITIVSAAFFIVLYYKKKSSAFLILKNQN